MKIFKYFIFPVFIILSNFSIKADIFFFDNFKWVKEKKFDDIKLYTYKNVNTITSFKAETIIKNQDAKLLYDTLLDFKNYPYIFPRTITFEKKEQFANNKYLFYSLINFSPLMNRDYYIELEYYTQKLKNGNNIYILRWSPYNQSGKFAVYKNIRRVKTIYGRWTIKELENNKLYISVEYHNDFEINAPASILNTVEKRSTVKAINNLLNFISDNKKSKINHSIKH